MRKTIKVPCFNKQAGTYEKEVAAHVYEPWAAHRRILPGVDEWQTYGLASDWVVTHMPTGLRLPTIDFLAKRAACAAAKRLRDVLGVDFGRTWTPANAFQRFAPTGASPEDIARVLAVCRELGLTTRAECPRTEILGLQEVVRLFATRMDPAIPDDRPDLQGVVARALASGDQPHVQQEVL